MTARASMTSVTNDTTRIRRLPEEYFVDTQRMPRIDLAALLIASGGTETEPVLDVSPRRSFGYGVPKYRPPSFARLYAATRFRWPGLFARLRTLFVIHALLAPPLEAHHILYDRL